MVYLLLDCEEFLATRRIAELKAALGDAEMAGLNTTVVSGATNPVEILGHAAMMPFLSERRLVIVEGYLAALDKRMAMSKSNDSAAHQEAAQLLTGLSQVPDFSDLVFVDKGIDKRRALWKGFTLEAKGKEKEKGKGEQIPGLQTLIQAQTIHLDALGAPDPKSLPGWIQQHAKSRGIAIDGRAIQMLAAFIGPNLRQIDMELEKLSIYARGRAITAEDVNLLVSDASEAVVWSLTDALSVRDGRAAMRAVQLLRRGDNHPIYLLTLIARQYRVMLKVKEAMRLQPRATVDTIAKRIGESPYPVQKAMQQVRNYSTEGLIDTLDRLLEADYAMKTGADPETELDILVAELTQKRKP